MIQRLERIFCKEMTQINLESQLLLHSIADKRAETKFHYIIQVIRRKIDPSKMDQGDELITYGEFYEALRSKPDFYKQMLPRTLNIEDVLLCQKTEEVYNISDFSYDDFVLFRYEMNTIFKRTHFRASSDENALDFGTSPLARVGGMLIRDLPAQERKKELELYRPPGIVNKVRYIQKYEFESQFGPNVWNGVPSNKIFVRSEMKPNNTDQDDAPYHNQSPEDGKNTENKKEEGKKEEEKRRRMKKRLEIKTTQKPGSDIKDQLDIFDTDFPLEYNEIANASSEDTRGMEKERDIKEMIKKNEKRFKEVKNLLPKESVIKDIMKNPKF